MPRLAGMGQSIALDTCVVIAMLERPRLARSLRSALRGKRAGVVLPDTVLTEVRRVRGHGPGAVRARVERLLGRRVSVAVTGPAHRRRAGEIRSRYAVCHAGDNMIVAVCSSLDLVLVTFDRMLLQACSFVGIAALHPAEMGGL